MRHSFATAETTILPPDAARVFFDGTFTTPKLSHPEGVAIGPDGWIWAGNEAGEIFRVSPDGAEFEIAHRVGGFALGLAFDGDRALFVCDLEHGGVVRVDLATGRQDRWHHRDLRIANFPLVDRASGRLFVSDSHAPGAEGPGVFVFDLATGAGALWHAGPMSFANGLAMRQRERALYVAETFARRVIRVEVREDGTAGATGIFAEDLPGLPDGIAFDGAGNLIVACYEPSRLLRVPAAGGAAEVLVEDVTAHTLCHPTNVAFLGDRLFAANLGRWHLAEIAVDTGAPPLVETTR